ncbi:MAG: hypothetical protein Q9227_005455 [Pyrenula ochraceoflavens]
MAPPLAGENDTFSQLRDKSNGVEAEARQKANLERAQKIHLQSQSRLAELLSLHRQKLAAHDIFLPSISNSLRSPSHTDPSTTPTDYDIYFGVKERGKIQLKTGTDLGNAEGSAYASLLLRNLFGGAESLNVNASIGTRTRSAYQAAFETPVLSDALKRWEIGGVQSSTQKSWASHEEAIKGGFTKFKWATASGRVHEIGYNGYWRRVTGLAANASPTVRDEAGDSVKSSVSHTWTYDARDHPFLPSKGFYMKTLSEIAGWGPLKGDVAFWKSEVETQSAVPVPIPGIKGNSGVSLTMGLRAGLLYPLALGFGASPEMSHINDRFQLGGPTNVRGFRESGLGPRDGNDAVGGDVFAAGSANLLCPLPRLGAESPLRFQAFLTGGRLLALPRAKEDEPMTSQDVRAGMQKTVSELRNGLPSVSAGVGFVYAHPVARFELNFSLPLVTRRGEEGRKGVSFGIGINFL